MKRAQRLRRAADFLHVREHGGRGRSNALLVLYLAPNDLDTPRVGITVSRRVGNAVMRNRVRRRLRAALDARLADIHGDLLVIARPRAAEATWPELCAALDDVLARATEAAPASV